MSTPQVDSEPKPTDRVGTVIGQRYKVASVLGEGGMAFVFLAEDLRHGRKVFQHAGLAPAHEMQRWLTEAAL